MEKIIFRNLTNVKFQQLKNAISKDKLRPQLMGVFLDVKNEKIVVTNGNVLVAYDIEIKKNELHNGRDNRNNFSRRNTRKQWL